MIVKTIPSRAFHEIWLVYFQHQGASANIAILQDKRDTAYLYDLFSTNRGCGEAAALLREIELYCLDNQITLIIEAEVYDAGKDGIQTNEQLKSWYEHHGAYFVEYGVEHGHPMLLLGKDFSRK